MKLLLTGAEGNLGSELCKQAAATNAAGVIAVGRQDWGAIDEKIAAAELVVHAASDLRTSASLEPYRLLDSNLMSTATLLEASRRHGLKRFVLISSCAVYGEDMRTGEDSLCCPITINGISKHLNEKLVAEFCTANRIEYQILRVFNTYGGRDRFSIFSKLKNALVRGTPFTLNNEGRMQRDFIHVSDVAHRHLNIGTGVATKVSKLVAMVAGQFPGLVIQPGVAQEAEYSRADTSRLGELWSGRFIGVEDYIRGTFADEVAAARSAQAPESCGQGR
ncbi:MAG: SDR family oxidoreductase [Betaproteobacteria bacterium]|nr:SDR family oxidoreductase [Betaproteobacteria bacterium]